MEERNSAATEDRISGGFFTATGCVEGIVWDEAGVVDIITE